MIPVTKPFVPPLEEYQQYLQGIWERQWLTNMGPLSKELESRLKAYLHVEHLLFVTNGTVALQMAIKALDLKGEIITTPFSFVATTSTIVWEACTPVFVDIDKETLNIDATKIEQAITDKTTAILATHVYGNPCDVEAIQQIADRHGLKVIYDGAHAFGVNINGRSVFEYGDISTCSLHATKLYHSGEGGLIITKNAELAEKLARIRNFGFKGAETFVELGINGKNSEFHAAMGLANLKYIQNIHDNRKLLSETYDDLLSTVDLRIPEWHKNSNRNYAYYPVIFTSEMQMLDVMKRLADQDIFTRRYFYPSLAATLPYLPPQHMPVTDNIARRVLCLPLFYDLTADEVRKVCSIIRNTQD